MGLLDTLKQLFSSNSRSESTSATVNIPLFYTFDGATVRMVDNIEKDFEIGAQVSLVQQPSAEDNRAVGVFFNGKKIADMEFGRFKVACYNALNNKKCRLVGTITDFKRKKMTISVSWYEDIPVLYSQNGKCFHMAFCTSCPAGPKETTWSNAIRNGLTPCSKCCEQTNFKGEYFDRKYYVEQ